MIEHSDAAILHQMDEVENIAVIRRMFGFVQGRGETDDFPKRWAAYAAIYDPEVVIHEAPSLPYGGDYHGPDAVARHAQAFQAAWDGLQPEGERAMEPQFFAGGDHVIVMWRLQAKSGSGEVFDMPVMSTYRLKDKRVVESRMFTFDAAGVRDFLSSSRDNHGG